MPRLENDFQSKLIRSLKRMFPGCYVLKTDPRYIQGFPDLLILYGNRWAFLECKKSAHEPYQPNQEYYLEKLDELSFASVIYPENCEEVLDDLQQTFSPKRSTRISKCKS